MYIVIFEFSVLCAKHFAYIWNTAHMICMHAICMYVFRKNFKIQWDAMLHNYLKNQMHHQGQTYVCTYQDHTIPVTPICIHLYTHVNTFLHPAYAGWESSRRNNRLPWKCSGTLNAITILSGSMFWGFLKTEPQMVCLRQIMNWQIFKIAFLLIKFTHEFYHVHWIFANLLLCYRLL